MSTILDALRKAKQAPTQDSVDARPEIISGASHNYLATVSDSPATQLQNLKMIVIVAGGIIAFLFILVIVLFAIVLRRMDTVPPASTPPAQTKVQPADNPPAEPAEAVVTPVAGGCRHGYAAVHANCRVHCHTRSGAHTCCPPSHHSHARFIRPNRRPV